MSKEVENKEVENKEEFYVSTNEEARAMVSNDEDIPGCTGVSAEEPVSELRCKTETTRRTRRTVYDNQARVFYGDKVKDFPTKENAEFFIADNKSDIEARLKEGDVVEIFLKYKTFKAKPVSAVELIEE